MNSSSWAFGWDAIGVIASVILSVLLIYFTIRIAKQQNKLQKDISDRDMRIQNYQHRAKCYLQIIEASMIMARAHSLNIANAFQGLQMDSKTINDLDQGQNLMLKTQLEAKLLFSPKLAGIMYKMFDNYAEYFQQTTNFIISQKKTPNFTKEIDFDKFTLVPKDPEVFQKIKEASPELASIMQLNHELSIQFKSKEFNDLLLNETKVL